MAFGTSHVRRSTKFIWRGRFAEPSAARFSELTEREEEILSLIAQGKSNQEIANGLFLNLKTVRNHASNIFMKLCR